MKRIVLTFGLLSGSIMIGMFLITLPFKDQIGFDKGMIIGYTSMVAASLLIYFGIRSYRDNVAGGSVSFGRALQVGSLIGLISALLYVASWEVIYFNFQHDYITKYNEYVLEKARAGGATEAQLATQKAELEKFATMYENPLINAAFTFLEPLPVIVVMTLISAGVASRRKRSDSDAVATSAGVAHSP